jgi:diketogulonate reductase-like aldo/keto reductase
MRHHKFGQAKREVAILGQGTYRIGEHGHDSAIEAMRCGFDEGMTHFDTAEMYDDGEAETLVGEAIAGIRDQVFLVSKVLPNNASRDGVIAACEGSLRRLRTDRLDCYLIHWPGEHPMAETIAGFEALVSAGKILSWGVSNFDVPDLDEAYAIAGPGRIACNQVRYDLTERRMEHTVMPWCAEHGVTLVGYKPYGMYGFPGPDTPGGKVLAEIGAAHGATPRQVAVAALARQAFIVVKAATAKNAADNAHAGDLVLSDEEFARIDAVLPRGPKPDKLPMW